MMGNTVNGGKGRNELWPYDSSIPRACAMLNRVGAIIHYAL